jgi:2-polyprenyl-6-methoxyphenol hydroxylase-like FAD-dependent oxidoreductase
VAAPSKIIIVGGGTAGWMTACLMAHQLAQYGTGITLIESKKMGTVGVGEGSTPYLKEFFDLLNIPEAQWMPACNATYKCGIGFPGWSTEPQYESYFHPFYSDLDGPLAKQFFDLCNARRTGENVYAHPDDFFVASALAQQNKAPVSEAISPDKLMYAYHFDAELLGQFLRGHALQLGVHHIDDKVTDVTQNAAGNIALLQTQNSGQLRGDFFVDCSGFGGLLIQKTLGEELVSYKKHLFNNSAVAIQTPLEVTNPLSSYTVSKALSCGWVWQIPLANRYGNGYVYSSDYLDKEQAEQELRDFLGPAAQGQKALHLHWQPGRIGQHWKRNCLAIGLSQGFLEPLEAPMLFVVQKSIERFIEIFTQCNFSDEKQDNYNKEINAMIDGTRDYLQAHYKLNSRQDTQYWRDNRDNPALSDTLRSILDTWFDGGNLDLVLHQNMHKLAYLKTSWYCLLAGKGRFTDTVKQPNTHLTNKSVAAKLEIAKITASFHDHKQYLQQLFEP